MLGLFKREGVSGLSERERQRLNKSAAEIAARHHEEYKVFSEGQLQRAGWDAEAMSALVCRQDEEVRGICTLLPKASSDAFRAAYDAEVKSLHELALANSQEFARSCQAEARELEEMRDGADPAWREREAAAQRIVEAYLNGQETQTTHAEVVKLGLAHGRAYVDALNRDSQSVLDEQMAASAELVGSVADGDEHLLNAIYSAARARAFDEGIFQWAGLPTPSEQAALRHNPAGGTVPVKAFEFSSASAAADILKPSSFWDHQVAKVRFLAGDFGVGTGHVLASGRIRLPVGDRDFAMTDVVNVELVTEEVVKGFGGAVGLGLVGGALFGAAGVLAGGLAGGNKKNVTFACTLRDGKRLLANADSKVYTELLAACFR